MQARRPNIPKSLTKTDLRKDALADRKAQEYLLRQCRDDAADDPDDILFHIPGEEDPRQTPEQNRRKKA